MKRSLAFWLLLACIWCSAPGQLVDPRLNPFISSWGRTDTQKEIEAGQQCYEELLSDHSLSQNDAYLRRVDRIRAQLVSALPSNPYPYKVLVLADNTVNAECFPGGYIVIFEGLLAWMHDDNQLAITLAHEMGHAYRRHWAREMRLEETDQFVMFTVAILRHKPIDAKLYELRKLAHSRDQEQEADEFGTELYLRAGFDPAKITDAMRSLVNWNKHEGERQPPEYLSDHPDTEERILDIQATADRLLRAGLKPIDPGPLPDVSVQSVFGKIPTLATRPCPLQPSETGMAWTYEVRSSGAVSQYSVKTVGVAQVDGTAVSRMEVDVAGQKVFYQQIVDEDHVYRRNRPEDAKSEWTIETAFPDDGGVLGAGKWAFKNLGTESIETPAGKFEHCLKLGAAEASGRVLTLWYAPNVGLVRRLNDKAGVDEVLVSFKRP